MTKEWDVSKPYGPQRVKQLVFQKKEQYYHSLDKQIASIKLKSKSDLDKISALWRAQIPLKQHCYDSFCRIITLPKSHYPIRYLCFVKYIFSKSCMCRASIFENETNQNCFMESIN